MPIAIAQCVFGYEAVHRYERWAWIPVPIAFAVMAGVSAKYMDSGAFGGSGPVEAASILTFGVACAGFALSLVSFAADYTGARALGSPPGR